MTLILATGSFFLISLAVSVYLKLQRDMKEIEQSETYKELKVIKAQALALLNEHRVG